MDSVWLRGSEPDSGGASDNGWRDVGKETTERKKDQASPSTYTQV